MPSEHPSQWFNPVVGVRAVASPLGVGILQPLPNGHPVGQVGLEQGGHKAGGVGQAKDGGDVLLDGATGNF